MNSAHKHTPRARRLRRNATPAETKLWPWVRNRRLLGWKFRRQFPIGEYIVDLVCCEAMLVVELDGVGHQFKTEYDARREQYLVRHGYRVLRFGNHEVTNMLHAVVETIVSALGPRGD
ncbi:MAG: DUF559 domain-containing protein [Archangium sp.]